MKYGKIALSVVLSLFLVIALDIELPGFGLADTAAQKAAVINAAPNSLQVANQKYFNKKSLIFSLDQTWLNGVVNAEDTVALDNIVSTLNKFKTNYEVYALLNPSNKDQNKVTQVLDVLQKNQIPFVLDQYSSDTQKSSMTNPYDPNYGLALSPDQLAYYKQRYGESFAGLRIFEVFATNFTTLSCKELKVDWCSSYKENYHLIPDRFYNKQVAENIIKFASDNKMFVLWTDFYWSFSNNWDFDKNIVKQPENEKELDQLIRKYPNVVLVSFANNYPSDGARQNNLLNTWFNNFKKYEKNGAIGFGLSNQGWMCNSLNMCPIDEIISWTKAAFENGAKVVQFEPAWYFWNLPTGTLDQWIKAGEKPQEYTKEKKWKERGIAKSNLKSLAASLGVDLSVLKTKETNDASCLNIDVPTQVKIGSNFNSMITFKNTGTKPWLAVNSQNASQVYKIGAIDFKLIPPYETSIWGQPSFEIKDKTSVLPNEQVTFVLQSKAPTTAGTYDYKWQMFEHGKEWFGQICEKKVIVYDGVPRPTNVRATCNGTKATVYWDLPADFDTVYLRVKTWPHPKDGTAIKWDDNYKGSSYTFNIKAGVEYNWWVHTKEVATSKYSTAIGTTFSCSGK